MRDCGVGIAEIETSCRPWSSAFPLPNRCSFLIVYCTRSMFRGGKRAEFSRPTSIQWPRSCPSGFLFRHVNERAESRTLLAHVLSFPFYTQGLARLAEKDENTVDVTFPPDYSDVHRGRIGLRVTKTNKKATYSAQNRQGCRILRSSYGKANCRLVDGAGEETVEIPTYVTLLSIFGRSQGAKRRL